MTTPLAPLRLQPISGPLYAEQLGELGPRIAFVHGFTQTGRSWLRVAASFTADHQVLLVDAPGHGGSAGVRADLRRGADMLAATAGRGTFIGYSMGGRLCMHLALAYPHLVDRLVLLGTNPGIPDDDDRQARRDADEQLAMAVERDGVPQFLNRWLANPLFATLQPSEADRTDRLRNTPEGLASSLRLAGTGAQDSLWGRLQELQMPTLVLAGDLDTKFTDIGRQLAAGLPRARFAGIPGAGHAAHLEQPMVTAATIAAFLRDDDT
jgi:2-succinyl-6-hydroxy-2,4-cyclohexadiene-1-carboxylate synthase